MGSNPQLSGIGPISVSFCASPRRSRVKMLLSAERFSAMNV